MKGYEYFRKALYTHKQYVCMYVCVCVYIYIFYIYESKLTLRLMINDEQCCRATLVNVAGQLWLMLPGNFG